MMIGIKDICFAAVALIAVLEAFEIRKWQKRLYYWLNVLSDLEEKMYEER